MYFKELVYAMAGNPVKMIHGEITNIDPILEWSKWLAYVPKLQKEKIRYLKIKRKKGLTLSSNDLKILKTYEEQMRLAKLFQIYGTSKISQEEYIEVYNYMINNSIDELMLSKLTKNEYSEAQNKIQQYSSISNDELEKKINFESQEENYKYLSMVDAYVLHILLRKNFRKNDVRIAKEIKSLIDSNELTRQRSYRR